MSVSIFLEPEEYRMIRTSLNSVTPYSVDLHDMLAEAAANKPEEQDGRDALAFLKQKGYLGVEVSDGTIFLGLPKYVSRALITALKVVGARRGLPALIPEQLPEQEVPDIYVGISFLQAVS